MKKNGGREKGLDLQLLESFKKTCYHCRVAQEGIGQWLSLICMSKKKEGAGEEGEAASGKIFSEE